MTFDALKEHVARMSFDAFIKAAARILARTGTLARGSPEKHANMFWTLLTTVLNKKYKDDPVGKRRWLDGFNSRMFPSIVDEVAKLDAAATVEGA